MSFDTLAPVYRTLEYTLFGRELDRARSCLDPELEACRSVLDLGEGDGRWLAGFLRRVPDARVTCVDASRAMLARAALRARAAGAEARVRFVHADARSFDPGDARYDAVVTCFFLDCFTDAQLLPLVERLDAALTRDARWLYADFAVPTGRRAARCARALLRVLYAFFRLTTGIRANALPGVERALAVRGWTPRSVREHRGGLLRTIVFERTRAAQERVRAG